MWLGKTRGNLIDWLTQRWVAATGRRVDLTANEWLDGPTAPTEGIGEDFFDHWADANGCTIEQHTSSVGLLESFEQLSSDEFAADQVDPSIAKFYEQTADYNMDVWSEWSGLFRPFAFLIVSLFSRRLRQLNLPISSIDTSRGITSQVLRLREPDGGLSATAWLRTLVKTGEVMYAGCYSVATPANVQTPCVKTVFPLPNGNAVVLLKPERRSDGSLLLVSEGKRFGDAGFYFTLHRPDGTVVARYVRSFRERIHVYSADDGVMRTDHTMALSGLKCLHLHYRLSPAV